MFSIVAATTLRALEIALCAFYPNMPRFAILRSALSWVTPTHPLPNINRVNTLQHELAHSLMQHSLRTLAYERLAAQ